MSKSFYDFAAKDIDGNEVSMSRYRDQVVIIVNVATNCGLAKFNYKQLNDLYVKYQSRGLRIAAFPSNSFGQEPSCEVDIKEFVTKQNIHYDFYSKVVVNGSNTHPIFQWLKSQLGGIFGLNFIKWNFTKFLLNQQGKPVKRYSPTTGPNTIEPDIVALLNVHN